MSRWYTIDSVVRSLLLKEGKPVHYYLQYLKHGCDALQKLNTHSLRAINTKKLPVTSYKAISLPCDFQDYVRVGFQVGERVRPMIEDSTLDRLYNTDSLGAKIPYTNTLPDGTDVDGFLDNFLIDYISNPYSTSPAFGHDASRDDWRFKVLKERNEIQLSADFPYSYVILEYITDGLEADNATMVDPEAREAIEKYILWQSKVHNRNASEGEKMAAELRFDKEHRLLRASKANWTRENIINAVRSGYGPLPHN
jgi:hypothetical protein